MDVRTQAGDIYALGNEVIVYGSAGIELRLNRMNLEKVQRVRRTQECLKDSDMKDRRFTVAYNDSTKSFRFEPNRGETVRVSEELLMKVMA